MYTITIENKAIDETGRAYASVCFSRETGDVEEYRDLILVTPAVEQVLNETGEVEVEGKEAVYEYTEIKTRPFVEVIRKNFYFNSQEHLDSQIVSEQERLTALVATVSELPIGEYTPTVVEEIEETPEQMAEKDRQDAKAEFLKKLAIWDAQRVAGIFITSRGGTISQEDGTAFYQLEQWLLQNWKAEYAVEAKQYLTALGLSTE